MHGVTQPTPILFCFRDVFSDPGSGLRSMAEEPKSYTCIRRKFNQVHPNQTAPVYRSAMLWDNMGRNTVRCARTMSNEYQKHFRGALPKSVHGANSQLRVTHSTVHDVLRKRPFSWSER